MKMIFNKNILIDIFNPFMKKRSHQKVITAMQIFLNKEIRIDMVLNQFMKECNISDDLSKVIHNFRKDMAKPKMS